jgi:hypothetical protein
MHLLDEENQKWYCSKDDEIYCAKEDHWGALPAAPSTIVAVTPCTCGRLLSHVHYSASHNFLVKLAATLIALLEGISFISGYVKGTVMLYPSSYHILLLSHTLAQLTEPFDYIQYLAYIPELIGIICVIIALTTLHSTKTKLHLWSLISGFFMFLLDMGLTIYYTSLVDAATQNLHSLVNADVFSDALQIQQQFEPAYGFWDSSAHYGLRVILIMTMLCFAVACFIRKPNLLHASQAPPTPSLSEETNHKFCRCCGAKIPKDSTFCEECGTKQT